MMSRKYERLVALATGGMATVFVARARSAYAVDRLVAMKRPHVHSLASSELRHAFLREAAIGAAIRHANVIGVHDFVVEDDVPHVVMEYVDGPSLAQLLRAAREARLEIPLSAALRIVLDACAGLHAAHEAMAGDGGALGVIHRDVCPHNIVVGRDGVSRVSDFGIAKCVFDAGSTTAPGFVKGRLAFIAPESFSGMPIDRRVDVYALAIVAWELFAGRPLVAPGPPAEIIAQTLGARALPPSAFRREVPAAIDDTILAALAKTPDARPATADAFAGALEHAANGARLHASDRDVAAIVEACCGPMLSFRANAIRSALARAA